MHLKISTCIILPLYLTFFVCLKVTINTFVRFHDGQFQLVDKISVHLYNFMMVSMQEIYYQF